MPSLPGAPTPTRPTSLITFTITVDGQALPGTVSVVAIDITSGLNRVPAARVVLYDGDAAKQDFEVSSGDLLVPGKSLEIAGGYDRKETPIFKGVITAQRIQVKRKGDSLLHIEARDPAFRLTLNRKSRYFTELTDSDLFGQILSGYAGLTPDVESTSIKHPEIVQYQVSDWDLVVSRAEKLGLYCAAEGGTLRIAKPDLGQAAALTLTYGADVFDLDLVMDARTQPKKVTASAWDQGAQDVVTAEVDDAPAPAHGNLAGPDLADVGGGESLELRHSGTLQQQEVDAWANAGMVKARLARIRGTVRCQGNEALKPGVLVELAGMGDRFNGTALVSGVRHVLGGGDWETVVEVGLPPAWHTERYPVSAPPGAGFTPAVNGLHTGVVSQLQDDPAGEERVLVRLPLISAADPGVWSRLATLDAGNNRGTVFRPEIGDEVIVGFVNDDPQEPVVLGMLHSSSKPAPLPASDDNHEKGLVTRSGMKVVFNDDTPSLAVETPAGNKVVVDDDQGSITVTDQNGNTVTLSSDGIALESAATITLKATGDVTIEGVNVTVKASAAAGVEGGSGAALKSSGTTEVKGSLVQVN
jgi:Rhs element Vgr protein